jgi:hypothetical protein
MSTLPPSPFMNAAATPLPAADTAGDPSPPSSPAVTNSVSVAQPSGTTTGTEAVVSVRRAAASDLTCDIPELLRVASYLCADARQFTPDYPSLYQAMLDPNAPRATETDPVWADDAPLFLRAAE